jgi:hypothetical protein
MLQKNDDGSADDSFFRTGRPRTDRSKVTIVLQRPSPPQSPRGVGDDDDDDDGWNSQDKFVSLQVDTDDLQEFLDAQRRILQASQEAAHVETQRILHDQLTEAVGECSENIPQFARWYFAYTTTYKLLSVAMKSATLHVTRLDRTNDEVATLKEAVTYDVQKYICGKYEAMVLRPAITDPKIRRAIVATLETVYRDVYLKALRQLDDSVQTFVQQHAVTPSKSLSISPNSIVMELDWRAQLQKAQHLPVVYEKTSPEFSVALIGTGAVAGKAMGGAAMKAMGAKLAAPFATKAATTALGGKAAAAAAAGAASTAGAAGGMVAGGPLGAGIGAAIGVGIDVAMNAGVRLMQRDAFERDVQRSLDATVVEWEERILPEVDRVVQDVWFAGAHAALSDRNNDSNNKSRSSSRNDGRNGTVNNDEKKEEEA